MVAIPREKCKAEYSLKTHCERPSPDLSHSTVQCSHSLGKVSQMAPSSERHQAEAEDRRVKSNVLRLSDTPGEMQSVPPVDQGRLITPLYNHHKYSTVCAGRLMLGRWFYRDGELL